MTTREEIVHIKKTMTETEDDIGTTKHENYDEVLKLRSASQACTKYKLKQ